MYYKYTLMFYLIMMLLGCTESMMWNRAGYKVIYVPNEADYNANEYDYSDYVGKNTHKTTEHKGPHRPIFKVGANSPEVKQMEVQEHMSPRKNIIKEKHTFNLPGSKLSQPE